MAGNFNVIPGNLSFTAGQTFRRKSDDSGWEAFRPICTSICPLPLGFLGQDGSYSTIVFNTNTTCVFNLY